MFLRPYFFGRGFLALIGLVALSASGTAIGQTISPEAQQWTVQPDFGKQPDVGREISGAACVPTSPSFQTCLAVNDQKKYAQFFSIDANVLKPGAYIRLRNEKDKGDPDAEGAAYDAGYFYVTGSHGRSRNSDKPNDSSYLVFRFKVDPATGKTPFEISDEKVVGVESSGNLRGVLASAVPINQFFDKPLNEGGLNVEGLAIKGGRMFIGFRGPSINKSAFILSVDANAVFNGPPPSSAQTSELPLGENVGIRDLASVEDGLLVLSGPMREEKLPYEIWLWDDKKNVVKKKLAVLDPAGIPAGAKAETLLVLATDPLYYRVLVMFDGANNGGPVSFRLPR